MLLWVYRLIKKVLEKVKIKIAKNINDQWKKGWIDVFSGFWNLCNLYQYILWLKVQTYNPYIVYLSKCNSIFMVFHKDTPVPISPELIMIVKSVFLHKFYWANNYSYLNFSVNWFTKNSVFLRAKKYLKSHFATQVYYWDDFWIWKQW